MDLLILLKLFTGRSFTLITVIFSCHGRINSIFCLLYLSSKTEFSYFRSSFSWRYVVFVEQSHLPGQTTPFMTAEVRAEILVCPRMEPDWQTTQNGSRDSTPGDYWMTLNFICQPWVFFVCFFLNHSFEITSDCLIYLKDWPRHGCAEPLRAIQRKRKAGFLQSYKEEKEKIPNGNLSSTCQFGMDALVHAYCTVCPLCTLNLLLPNFYHICRNMKSFFVFVQCHVSLPWIMVLCIADAGPWRKVSCHQEISFPSV